MNCPNCRSKRIKDIISGAEVKLGSSSSYWHTECLDCGYKFERDDII